MGETVLLVGGGGREHAIARALDSSTVVDEVFVAASNRNPGIASLATDLTTMEETATADVVEYAVEHGCSIAVIGPEAPLEAGIVDTLEAADIYAFGPPADQARIETDKAWQRSFMAEHGIRGRPEFAVFDSTVAATEYVRTVDGDVAVKPTGLTGGKGVRVTGDQLSKPEAIEYMEDAAYDEWVIEERLVGEEFTVQAFVANDSIQFSPAVQDHKRAYEGDEGPNTGGMGSYAAGEPILPFMTEAEYAAATDILEETITALGDYRGILYGQFMLTAEGPKVVEFNARFGDPEAMNTLPILETDFGEILTAAKEGRPLPELSFKPLATVCKYAVPVGYPTSPEAGARITVDEATIDRVNATAESSSPDGIAPAARLYYASVDEREDGIYTTTSRAFAVVGLAEEISDAEAIAERALDAAGSGVRIRHDIGTDALIEQRISHMKQLRG